MRIFSPLAGFALLVASSLAPAYAADEQAQPTPAEAPSAAQSAEEPGQPGITIRQGEPETQVTEKRQGGQVKEVKVKKGKNNTYFMRPNQATSGGPGAVHTTPPQWVVKEIGPGKEPKKDKGAPPPPASAPTAQDNNAPEKK